MKPSVPFFSIIITTFNRAVLLKRAIESLLAQTEQDWEAIIVNDGSTDNTELIVQPYLQNKKIKYIFQDNQGCVGAKNTGLQAATGQYISFLDADDEYQPSHLALRKEVLINDSSIDILHGGLTIIGSEYVPDMFNHQQLIHLNNCVVGGTFFIKNKWATILNGFDNIPMGHDADFLERAKLKSAVIATIDASTYIYHREVEDSMTHNLKKELE